MIYRRLGRTGLNVSLLGLGSGGHNVFGQKAGVPESEIHRLVRHALEKGVNLFDSAPEYLDSESILGRALQGVPRDRYILSTKVNVAPDPDSDRMATSEQVIRSVDNSLRRLQVMEIDVLLVGGSLRPGMFEVFQRELLPTLEGLQRSGKVRFLGTTEDSGRDGAHEWLARALPEDTFDVAMAAYNMINQSAQKAVFPICSDQDIGTLVVYAVRNVFSQPARLQEVVTELERRGTVAPGMISTDSPFGWLLEEEGENLVSAAYRFVVGNDTVSTVMTSTNSISHLDENVEAIQRGPLSPKSMNHLRHLFEGVAVSIGN